jgi:hypothetical protein
MPDPMPITGKVEIEDTKGQREDAPRLLFGISSDELRIYGSQGGGTSARGELQIPGNVIGEVYQLELRNRQPDIYIASVTQGDRPIAEGPLLIKSGAGPLHILLRKDGGLVSGTVMDGDKSAPLAFVALIPKNRSASHNFRTATADKNGAYQLTGISPGEYNILAFDRNEDDQYLDEGFVAKLISASNRVTVGRLGTLSMDLKAVKVGSE